MTNSNITNAWNNLTKSAMEFGKVSINEFIDDIQANATNSVKQELEARQNTATEDDIIATAVAKNPQSNLTPKEVKQNLSDLKQSGQELFDMVKKAINESLSV